jgi:hypothetical protein
MIKRIQILFLILVPLVFLVIGFKFDRTKYGTDPESAYLFNGLNVAMGEPVGLYDHPGITVHIYNAAIISVTHFFRFTNTDLQTDVLVNSEYYIEVLRKSFIVLNTMILFLLGFVTLSVLNNAWLAVALQIGPFLSTTLTEELSTKVSPEQLLFSSTLLLIMLILKYYSSLNKQNKWFAVTFGILGGFGLATKFTFLPLLVIPYIILKGERNKVFFGGMIIPSFILFTLPAAHDYKPMFKWFLSIASHTGIYGEGSKGIIDPKVFTQSLMKICMTNLALLFALLASLLMLIMLLVKSRRKSERVKTPETDYILALFLALVGSILMVAKHYYNNHYLFPALSIMSLVFVFINLWLERVWQNKNMEVLKFSSPALVVIFLVIALFNKPYLALAFKGYKLSNKSTDETMARIERDYPGYVKTFYYPGSFNQYAQLRWGNVYARQFHTNRLMELFPEGLFYDIRDNSFHFWETTIPPEEFMKKYGSRILLIGGPVDDNDLKLVEDGGLKLKKQFEGRLQVVYEVDTAESTFFRDNIFAGRATKILTNDFEILSVDKQWIMAESSQFCRTSSLTNEKPRSGKYSFSLPEKDTYAMEYKLRNIVPGEHFEVSIWCFGGDREAILVASAADSDLFYKSSTSTGEKDARGWNKIGLVFRIPMGFKEKQIKLYLWNHGEKPAWFDDFKLTRYE